jgi:hypothetical protein
VATAKSLATSRVVHLHTEKSGMSWFAAGQTPDEAYLGTGDQVVVKAAQIRQLSNLSMF